MYCGGGNIVILLYGLGMGHLLYIGPIVSNIGKISAGNVQVIHHSYWYKNKKYKKH